MWGEVGLIPDISAAIKCQRVARGLFSLRRLHIVWSLTFAAASWVCWQWIIYAVKRIGQCACLGVWKLTPALDIVFSRQHVSYHWPDSQNPTSSCNGPTSVGITKGVILKQRWNYVQTATINTFYTINHYRLLFTVFCSHVHCNLSSVQISLAIWIRCDSMVFCRTIGRFSLQTRYIDC